MAEKKFQKKLILILIFFSLCYGDSVYPQLTQDMERAIKEVDHPFRKKAEEKIIKPPKKTPKIERKKEKKVPKGPKFYVKKIHLLGITALPQEIFTLL